MVQVGCTINYGRKCLWKKRQKLSNHRFLSCYFVFFVVDDFWQPRSALTISARSARMIKAVLHGQPLVSPKNGPVAQLGARFHGMEEVVGSIPTRSTKSHHPLDCLSPPLG